MPVILRPTPIGKRAFIIAQTDLQTMIDAGTAMQCHGYEIFEEVSAEEVAQGYMTRNMEALPPAAAKRRSKPAVAPSPPPPADETSPAPSAE